MNSIEEIRQTVAGLISTLHATHHATIPLNWPNYITVDLENLTGTFVLVNISVPVRSEILNMGFPDSLIAGELVVSTLRPLRTGHVGFSTYSDTLQTHICNRNISGINYLSLRKADVSPYPGIVGQMNTIPFYV